jgi:hypothetical protein
LERLDTEGHINGSLLRYLDYKGVHKLNKDEKDLYLIKKSKVNKIQKGHVVLEHPVITFTEGDIPSNTYHNTLAFRFSIGLERNDNESEAYLEEKKQAEAIAN